MISVTEEFWDRLAILSEKWTNAYRAGDHLTAASLTAKIGALRVQSKYPDLLRDPRWQQKRLKIMLRDEWACQDCGDGSETLNVHHLFYLSGMAPWSYPDYALITLCETCHGSKAGGRWIVDARPKRRNKPEPDGNNP